MAKKPQGKGRGGAREGSGQPKIELDAAQAAKLGTLMPSVAMVAAHYGVDPKTVDARLADDPKFALAFARGQASAKMRLSGTGIEQACGFWVCPACNRPLRVPEPTLDDPENVRECPDHGKTYFGNIEDKEGNSKQRPWRKWRAGNPIANIWQSKQHLGYSDRSFLEQEFQRDMSKVPVSVLLDLAAQAFRVLGMPLPADLAVEIQKRSNNREGSNGRDEDRS